MVKKAKFSRCHIMFCFNKIKSNQAKDDIWEPLAKEETVSTRPLHHSRVHSVQLFCVCSFGLTYFVELETLFKFKLKLWFQNDFRSYGWQKLSLLLLLFSPLAQYILYLLTEHFYKIDFRSHSSRPQWNCTPFASLHQPGWLRWLPVFVMSTLNLLR